MLSKDENEALIRVGPGTLMGNLMRSYWIPFYLGAELQRDDQPQRVRLLGESLIVYRDSAGAVGLLEEQCCHRGASLYYARNEECGLRCVYHGWKYDTTGACVDQPNEPPENAFKTKVRQPGYPCLERNGVVWTYMGPLRPLPPLPDLEWNTVPESRCALALPRVQESNYLQPIEGEYDSSHAPILHAGLPGATFGDKARNNRAIPRFYTRDTGYGVLIGARYKHEGNEGDYWRIYPFQLPFYTLVNVNPTQSTDILFSGHAFVPMDDEHTLAFGFTWHPTRDLTERERTYLREGAGFENIHPTHDSFLPRHSGPYGAYWPKLNASNDFGHDYAAQRSNLRWSGVPGLWPQDVAVQVGFGPITDRTKEHLGAADAGQIAMRKRLLGAARALRDRGTTPPGVEDPSIYVSRPTQTLIPPEREEEWYREIEPLVAGPYAGA
jgi:phenylpropionate dioxygenase-like ring-hydroxylating dioxygenase large terminal subunit